MRLRGGEGDQLAIVVDRDDERDVREVRAPAGVGIVRDHHVAGRQVLRPELLERRADREGQRSEETGDAVSLRDQVSACIDQARGEVQAPRR